MAASGRIASGPGRRLRAAQSASIPITIRHKGMPGPGLNNPCTACTIRVPRWPSAVKA